MTGVFGYCCLMDGGWVGVLALWEKFWKKEKHRDLSNLRRFMVGYPVHRVSVWIWLVAC